MTFVTSDIFVITEAHIFKFLVQEEGAENAHERVENARKFLHRVNRNIFTDEYHILYDCIQQINKYGIALTYDFLHQILLNNAEKLVTNPLITLFNAPDISQTNRQEMIIDHVLATFDELLTYEVEDSTHMLATVQAYIDTWCKQKMEEIIHKQLQIITEGVTVNRKFYHGVEDAKAYYDNAYSLIRSLLLGQGDVLSESIDTSTMTVEEIRESMVESQEEIVSRTGIATLDNLNEYRKGEIVTIQAGTGVGKTRFANAMGYNSLSLEKNVLYVTFEQKASRVWALQQARHVLERFGYKADIDDKTILRKTYNVENTDLVLEAENDLVNNDSMGRLRIESINLHATAFEAKLTEVWESGFHFDVVVIDYLGLLLTSGGSRYEILTDFVNTLKSNVKSFKGQGFLAIVLNQLTKEAEKAILAGNFDSGKSEGSETQYLARASDYIYTLIQTNEDKLLNKMTLLIDKVRLGNVPFHKLDLSAFLGQSYFSDYAPQQMR